jgi:hypothetical protein
MSHDGGHNSHRDTILGDWTNIGIGIVPIGGGSVAYVIDFAKR